AEFAQARVFAPCVPGLLSCGLPVSYDVKLDCHEASPFTASLLYCFTAVLLFCCTALSAVTRFSCIAAFAITAALADVAFAHAEAVAAPSKPFALSWASFGIRCFRMRRRAGRLRVGCFVPLDDAAVVAGQPVRVQKDGAVFDPLSVPAVQPVGVCIPLVHRPLVVGERDRGLHDPVLCELGVDLDIGAVTVLNPPVNEVERQLSKALHG